MADSVTTAPPNPRAERPEGREGRRKIDDILPLTPPQRGMLFESLARAGSGIHLEQMYVDLVGELDVEALLAAWRHAAVSHASLRTCFVWRNQELGVRRTHELLAEAAGRLPVARLRDAAGQV